MALCAARFVSVSVSVGASDLLFFALFALGFALGFALFALALFVLFVALVGLLFSALFL